ncbi:MAG: hypothetical protein JWQ21_1669 [Herminiimonas sp.]|nr:hypothetical protein [Herminiimonas sp.]
MTCSGLNENGKQQDSFVLSRSEVTQDERIFP